VTIVCVTCDGKHKYESNGKTPEGNKTENIKERWLREAEGTSW